MESVATSISLIEIMNINFSQLFHHYSKHEQRWIPYDSAEWPESWKTIQYKAYPRFSRIALPGHVPQCDLFDVLRARTSCRRYVSNEKGGIDLHDLSALLRYSTGVIRIESNGDGRRSYPSAGARYPIESYCLVINPGVGLRKGLYHYHARDHQLEAIVRDNDSVNADIARVLGQQFVADASAIIFLTATFARAQEKYGERGYRFCLLEAGHIGQTIGLVAEALNLGACALGGSAEYDVLIEGYLGIDGVTEALVHSVTIGTPKEE